MPIHEELIERIISAHGSEAAAKRKYWWLGHEMRYSRLIHNRLARKESIDFRESLKSLMLGIKEIHTNLTHYDPKLAKTIFQDSPSPHALKGIEVVGGFEAHSFLATCKKIELEQLPQPKK